MNHADLHFHLLPGVDDGPEDLDASLELARAAVADGTRTVVATPHVRRDLGVTDPAELTERASELRAAMADEGLPLELCCGGELGHEMVGRLSQAELDLLAQGPATGRWLLVEAPFEGMGAEFHAATAELRERGFGVVVAHPERSADAELDGAHGLRAEHAAGSLAQVNAQSLTGEHGTGARLAAWELLTDDLVAIVASDAHGPTRPPALRAAERALVEGGLPGAVAAALIGAGPHRLLASGIRPRRAVAA